VLIGEAHSAVGLVGDGGTAGGGLTDTGFGGGDFSQCAGAQSAFARYGFRCSICGSAGSSCFASKFGEAMLNRLELTDRAAKLAAFQRILHRLI